MNEHIEKLGKACLRILPSETETETNSFLGGMPRVSEKIDWPIKNDQPLAFIAQLDLREVNTDKQIDWLPDSGRLLFFYDMDDYPWGFDPADKGGWAVIYDNGNNDLFELKEPENIADESRIPTKKYVKIDQFMSYPSAERLDLEAAGILDYEQYEKYREFVGNKYEPYPYHQMDGYPYPIQRDSMEKECQLVSGGVYCGNPFGYKTDKAQELMKDKNDWVLLFQFDSDDDIDVMWGDDGMLYFWVREGEARQNNFSNSWLISQCR